MSVDITQCGYAGVWREAWPEKVAPGGIVPDLSGHGRHAHSVDHNSGIDKITWELLGAGEKWAGVFNKSVTAQLDVAFTVRAVSTWMVAVGQGGLAEQYDGTGWAIMLSNNVARLIIDGTQISLGVTVSDEGLHHVAVAWSGTHAYAWVDGLLVKTAAIINPPTITTPTVQLGSAVSAGVSGQYRLSGKLSDVLLRDTPWTDAEVAWLANPANDLRTASGGRSSPRLRNVGRGVGRLR